MSLRSHFTGNTKAMLILSIFTNTGSAMYSSHIAYHLLKIPQKGEGLV